MNALCGVSALKLNAFAINYTKGFTDTINVASDTQHQCDVNVSQSIVNGTFYAEEPLFLNLELTKNSIYLDGVVTIIDISDGFRENQSTGTTTLASHKVSFVYNKSGQKRIYIHLFKSPSYYISYQEFNLVYRTRPLKVISSKLVISKKPNETTTKFSITVQIYWENDMKDIFTLRDFNVSLNLVPGGEFLGRRSGKSSSGFITFTDLIIKEEGIFRVEASGPGLHSNVSESFSVVNTELVDSIVLNSSISSIKTGDYFLINFYLFNYSKQLFASPTTVTLYTFQKDFLGPKTTSTYTGSGQFNVSLDSLGPVTFKAFSKNDTRDPSVQSLTINVYDKLCKQLNSDYSCQVCVSLSYFDDEGTCKCSENAYEHNYNCFCKDGYEIKDGACVECGNYILTHNVKGSLQDDLKSVVIQFVFQVDTSLFNDCLRALVLPEELAGYSFRCTWLSSFALVLKTEKVMQNKGFVVKVVRELVPATTVCVVYSEALVNVSPVKYQPWPDIKLFGPDSYSISCSNLNLALFVSPIREEYELLWTLTLNSKLVRTVAGQTSLILEKHLLDLGLLSIKVIISSPLASKPLGLTKTIMLTNEQTIDLQMNHPSYSKVKKSQSLFIKVSAFDRCSSSTAAFLYSWKYISANQLDISKILLANTTDSIRIPANVFQVSNLYSFQVSVSKEGSNITGVQNLTFEVESEDIQISFDTWGGVFKTGKVLKVQARAFDPDEPAADLDYKWTCTQGTRICRDDDQDIINSANSSLLSVNSSHLKHGQSYVFTLTVSKVFKTSQKSVEFSINKNFQADLFIPSTKRIQPRAWPMTVVPNITTSAFFTFRWSFSPPLKDPWSYENDKLFVFVPKNQLTAGVTYKLTLLLKDSNQEKFAFSTFIECPASPKCGLFDARQEENDWVLSIRDCASGAGLLTYQFGVVYNFTYFDKMTLKIASPEVRLELKDDVQKVFVEVCDSHNCETFVALVKNRRERLLGDLEDAENMIKNPEDVLRAIYLYGDHLNSTQFTFLYERFLEFFQRTQFDEATFYLYLEKLNIVLRRSDSINKYVFRDIINVLVQEYLTQQYSLSSFQMKTLLDSIDAYVIQNSTLYNLDLLNTLARCYLNNTFPSSKPLIHSKGYFVYFRRLTGEDLSSLVLRFDGWQIEMPANKTVDANKIYDLVIIKLNTTQEVISIKVFQAGYYDGYNLVFTERLEDSLNATSPGTVSLFYEIDSDYHYKCKVLNENSKKWKTSGCSLPTLDSDLTETEFDEICTMKIAKVSKKCPFNFYPIVALAVLLLVTGYLAFVFNRNDQVRRGFLKPKTYLTIHPIISFMFVQRYRVRVNLLIQMFANTMLLFAMIGFLHNYFAYPLKASYGKYERFLDYHAEIGAIGFGVSQAFILPCFILNSFLYVDNKYFWIMNIVRAVIALPSIGGIIAMSIIYCGQFTYRWLINFVIFFAAQIIFLEAIYAFLIEMCIGDDQSRFKRVSTIKFFGASDSDDFESASERARSTGYLFKVYKHNKVVPDQNS